MGRFKRDEKLRVGKINYDLSSQRESANASLTQKKDPYLRTEWESAHPIGISYADEF